MQTPLDTFFLEEIEDDVLKDIITENKNEDILDTMMETESKAEVTCNLFPVESEM